MTSKEGNVETVCVPKYLLHQDRCWNDGLEGSRRTMRRGFPECLRVDATREKKSRKTIEKSQRRLGEAHQ